MMSHCSAPSGNRVEGRGPRAAEQALAAPGWASKQQSSPSHTAACLPVLSCCACAPQLAAATPERTATQQTRAPTSCRWGTSSTIGHELVLPSQKEPACDTVTVWQCCNEAMHPHQPAADDSLCPSCFAEGRLSPGRRMSAGARGEWPAWRRCALNSLVLWALGGCTLMTHLQQRVADPARCFCLQVFETWLHPSKFCTVMCTEGQACKRKVCWFAHSPEELRAPEPAAAAPPQAAAAVTPTAVSPCGSSNSLQQQPARSPPASAACYMAAARGPLLHNDRRMSAASYSDRRMSAASYSDRRMSAASYNSATSSSTASASLYPTSCSSASSAMSGNGSYYVRKASAAGPLLAGSAGPAHMTASDSSMLTQLALQQHSARALHAAALQDLQQQQSLGTGPCGAPGLSSPLAALAPCSSPQLMRQLQHMQQCQDLLGLSPSLPQAATEPVSPLSGLIGLSDSNAVVPVSTAPMLPTTAGVDTVLALGPPAAGHTLSHNSLSGLVTSLEEQAWQAQLQAAHAQAAAAAASSNLNAVLSVLTGLSVSQPVGGSAHMGSAGAAGTPSSFTPTPATSAAGAGFQFAFM